MIDTAVDKVIETLAARICDLENEVNEKEAVGYAAKRALDRLGKDAVKIFAREMLDAEELEIGQIRRQLMYFHGLDLDFMSELSDKLKSQET